MIDRAGRPASPGAAVADPASPAPARPPGEPIRWQADAGFRSWLAHSGGTLAVSTYQGCKLILADSADSGAVRCLFQGFGMPMGIAYEAGSGRLALATRNALWCFDNVPQLAPRYGKGHAALFLPRCTWPAAGLHLHDVAFAGADLCAVNTSWSCLAWLRESSEPGARWRPPFVNAAAAEDRCHLNGLCVVDGRPAFVTALGETDRRKGWREGRLAGGIVVHVDSGRTVARGLCMPHSPRWHRDTLWLLNAGQGALMRCQGDELVTVCELQGFARGLALVGDYALVCLSQLRDRRDLQYFGGMPVAARHPELLCGVAVVHLDSGALVGMLRFTSGVHELYDACFLPGIRNANILPLRDAAPAYPSLG